MRPLHFVKKLHFQALTKSRCHSGSVICLCKETSSTESQYFLFFVASFGKTMIFGKTHRGSRHKVVGRDFPPSLVESFFVDSNQITSYGRTCIVLNRELYSSK